MSEAGERLERLGVTLPVRDRKGKGVVDAVQVGDLLFISAHFLTDVDGKVVYTGRVDADIDKETTYQATRFYGLNMLATIKDYIEGLDRVGYVVKVLGLVNSTGDFSEQSAVMDGSSDLVVEALGKRGQHARSAMGVYVLEQNMPVTVGTVIQIRR